MKIKRAVLAVAITTVLAQMKQSQSFAPLISRAYAQENDVGDPMPNGGPKMIKSLDWETFETRLKKNEEFSLQELKQFLKNYAKTDDVFLLSVDMLQRLKKLIDNRSDKNAEVQELLRSINYEISKALVAQNPSLIRIAPATDVETAKKLAEDAVLRHTQKALESLPEYNEMRSKLDAERSNLLGELREANAAFILGKNGELLEKYTAILTKAREIMAQAVEEYNRLNPKTKLEGGVASAEPVLRSRIVEMPSLDVFLAAARQDKSFKVVHVPQAIQSAGVPDAERFTNLLYRYDKQQSTDADIDYFKKNIDYFKSKVIDDPDDQKAFKKALDNSDMNTAMSILKKYNPSVYDARTALQGAKFVGRTGNFITVLSAGFEYRIHLDKAAINQIEGGVRGRAINYAYLAIRTIMSFEEHEMYTVEPPKEKTMDLKEAARGVLDVGIVDVLAYNGRQVGKFSIGARGGWLYIKSVGHSFVSSVYGTAEGDLPVWAIDPSSGMALALRLGLRGEVPISGDTKPHTFTATAGPNLVFLGRSAVVNIYTGEVGTLDVEGGSLGAKTTGVGGVLSISVTTPLGTKKGHISLEGFIRAMTYSEDKKGSEPGRTWLDGTGLNVTVTF
ncbi:MAG: hypothetical protein HZA83_03170 [Thaumarchaeota archaeon]|nr:hypothetical protein [Nitrososphaerota archaeon]